MYVSFKLCNYNACFILGKFYCNCKAGYAGRACNLDLSGPSVSQGRWTRLAGDGVGFENQTGHSAVYDEIESSLWVYGGYNLTVVTDQLIRFNISTSRWQL